MSSYLEAQLFEEAAQDVVGVLLLIGKLRILMYLVQKRSEASLSQCDCILMYCMWTTYTLIKLAETVRKASYVVVNCLLDRVVPLFLVINNSHLEVLLRQENVGSP